MPKAIFLVPIVNGQPLTPPMSAEDGEIQLHYTDNGVTRGGFSVIHHVPPDSCLMRFESSDEMLDAIAAEDDYLFLDDCVEPEEMLDA